MLIFDWADKLTLVRWFLVIALLFAFCSEGFARSQISFACEHTSSGSDCHKSSGLGATEGSALHTIDDCPEDDQAAFDHTSVDHNSTTVRLCASLFDSFLTISFPPPTQPPAF